MGTKAMTYEEAARILDPETNLEALRAYAGDCEARQAAIVEACRMGARALRALPSSEPLTAEQLREMDGEPVWVEFEDGSGGLWGIVHMAVLKEFYPTLDEKGVIDKIFRGSGNTRAAVEMEGMEDGKGNLRGLRESL